MLTIPGRPQSKLRNQRGEILTAGHAYVEMLRYAAGTALAKTPPRAGSIRLDIHLYYATEHYLPIDAWHKNSIPNADIASSLILQALTGVLFSHASQVNPLIIHRHAIHPIESVNKFGPAAERGATVITWEAAEADG